MEREVMDYSQHSIVLPDQDELDFDSFLRLEPCYSTNDCDFDDYLVPDSSAVEVVCNQLSVEASPAEVRTLPVHNDTASDHEDLTTFFFTEDFNLDFLEPNLGLPDIEEDDGSRDPQLTMLRPVARDDSVRAFEVLPTSSSPMSQLHSTRFTQSQIDTLRRWYDQRARNPYPQSKEVGVLARATGLTDRQVRTWFSKIRLRNRKLNANTCSTPASIVLDPKAITQKIQLDSNTNGDVSNLMIDQTHIETEKPKSTAQSSLGNLPASPVPRTSVASSDDSQLKANIAFPEPSLAIKNLHKAYQGPVMLWWLETLPCDLRDFEKIEVDGILSSDDVNPSMVSFTAKSQSRSSFGKRNNSRDSLRMSKRVKIHESHQGGNAHGQVDVHAVQDLDLHKTIQLPRVDDIEHIDSTKSVCLDSSTPTTSEMPPTKYSKSSDRHQYYQTLFCKLKNDIQRLQEVLEQRLAIIARTEQTTKCMSETAYEEVLHDEGSAYSISGSGASSAFSAGSSCSYTAFGARRGRRGPRDRSNDTPHIRGAHATAACVPCRLAKIRCDKTWPVCDQCKHIALHCDYATYQCAFCPDRFSQKWMWKRHEESTHVAPYVWVCKPLHGLCNFCDVPLLTQPPCPHRAQLEKCWSRPLKDREFTRKDGLRQHWKQIHKVVDACRLDMHRESRTLSPEELTCPICKCRITTWSARVDHVASHFERGLGILEQAVLVSSYPTSKS